MTKPELLVLAAFLTTTSLAACQSAPNPGGGAYADPPAIPVATRVQLDSHPVAFPQYPTVSPDGTAIVFAYAGDLWSVPAAGGVAERLTAHPSDEDRSAFSPDGRWLAFESERDGPRNIYVMPVARLAPEDGEMGQRGALVGGTVRRVTISDKAQALSGFSQGGKYVYFSASLEPSIYRMTRMYRAPVDGPEGGGAVVERLSDAFGGSPHACADGTILFNRERYDPTRTKYVGAASCDVYRFSPKMAAEGGGGFTQLTSNPHSDGDAFGLPDGSVVYVSSRDGENNIFKLKPGATDKDGPQQLTKFAVAGPGTGKDQTTIMHGVRDLNVSGWTAVFCVWDTMYTLDLRDPGAKPREVPLTAGGDFAQLDFQRINAGRTLSDTALSPDGKTLAVIARGEIFIRSTDKDRPTRHVTATGKPSPWGRCRDLVWAPDGKTLYFSSDASGVSGIYAATVALSREDLTSEELPDRVAEPKPDPAKAKEPEPAPGGAVDPNQPAAKPKEEQPEPPAAGTKPDQPAGEEKKDGAAGAGEKKADKKPEKKPDHGKRWSEAVTFTIKPLLVSDREQRRPIPSPDGKRLLLTRDLGDLVMFETAKLEAGDAGEGRTLVKSWTDTDPQWAADSRHIVYEVQDYNFNSDIWLLDTLATEGTDAAKPINLTRHPDLDHGAQLSPDGKVLYFLSDRDASSNGEDDIFYVYLDRKLDGLRPYELADYFKEAADKVRKRRPLGAPAAPAGGPAASSSGSPSGSPPGAPGGGPGGRRRGGGGEDDALMVAESEQPAAEEKKDEPKQEAKAEAKPESSEPSPEKPLTFETEDAYLRVRKLSGLPSNIGNMIATPGAERVLFTASIDGTTQFLSVDYAGRERRTVFAGPAGGLSMSLTGEKVLFTSGGASPRADTPTPDDRPRFGGGGDAYLGRPAGGESERLSVDAPLVIDIAAQQRQKFLDAARLMGARFYHPTLKGLDWPALTQRYLSLAEKTRTDTEFNRIFNNLLGELEGSHMGMSGGRSTSGDGQSIGYLGIDYKAAPGGYEVTRVIANGPADRKSSKLAVGDVIVSINSKPLAPAADKLPPVDFMAAMQGTSGQETLIEIRPAAGGNGRSRHMLITPTSSGADGQLRYRDEVLRNAAAVEKLSGGKLGYLHIRAMDMGSVRDFERDLFAAADGKLGLIIDVRDNGGGSTNDILLASLTAPRHAYTASRGVDLKTVPKDAYPRDRRLIYGYSRPITVLCNQHSYSNAEIFSHAIKTIGRGTLVGMPTFGAVISTGSYSLIDGTTMRTPFRGWYLPDGKDMENNGAEPHIKVPQTPQDEAAGKDRQLEKAVEELLGRAKEP